MEVELSSAGAAGVAEYIGGPAHLALNRIPAEVDQFATQVLALSRSDRWREAVTTAVLGDRCDPQQARLFRSPRRYVWPAELDLMAQLAGFELETRHAD